MVARVLVVDDDEDLRRLVERHLQKAGHRVAGAATAEQALALIDERGTPDLAVLDVAMPGLSGLELLDTLRDREATADLPAIFLSARVQQHDIEAGEARNALYLTKPFVASALLSAVDRLLAGSEEESARTW